MKHVYITGSSLTCALGNDKSSSVSKALSLDSDNYQSLTKVQKTGYFKITQSFSSEEEKFYSSIKNTVLEAINDAKLSKDEQKELHIFIGSTSMSISINEEQSDKYYNQNDPVMLKEIGYGNIGSYIEDIVKSIHKATIIQTACTSTANGIAYATQMIKAKKIKKALVVGIELFNKSTYNGFESLMLPSKTMTYRPFDKRSDGLILGESCSAVVLEPEKKDPNDFEVLSSAITFDNYSITGSDPEGKATFSCMQKALDNAGLLLEDITCLKAHATGSENSNLSEAKAIDTLFSSQKAKCDVIVLKPFLGHTLGSCGTSEVILLCELIKNGILPKTLNYESGYEDINFEPLKETKEVNHATILCQFIGFGGSNTALILSNEKS